MESSTGGSANAVPRLKRVLSLWDLILYGIVLIMPIAAVPLFGVVQKLSNGHAVTTILVAMVNLGALASIEAGPAAVYFCGVVITTMLAAMSFDPRLIWDNCEENHE